jgi:hypothetical protein
MYTLPIAMLIVGVSACSIASAETTYRLERCAQFEQGVSLSFLGTRREVRRMFLGPDKLELSGNVKGVARLSQVKELALQPVFSITYKSGSVVKFGPIDAACQSLLRRIGGPLVHIQE